ncbi:MAG TPA: hypothetical protein PK239_01955 [Chitinophagales bacterium]|nr:hypothetical protein [Chitinophagales bacterium]HRK26031.1 hypothetical protein [Chitinophagales bacterium]
MQAITQSGKNITINDRQEINRGGEGRILLLPELPAMVAKLSFDPNKVISKAQLQALQTLNDQYFVKPAELVLEATTRKALGFTMPLLPKEYVPLTAFFSEPFCRKHGFNDRAKRHIALQIHEAMVSAHRQQIVLGDLSGLNIMVHPHKGSIRLIDTDAYETKAQKHSGILLDEIRDYYYGGLVSKESDYFAFAVLVFQLFTYLHPYKGIHRIYPTLRERMIQRIPVFDADTNLTVPKCYQPITDAGLQKQFVDIFKLSGRFALELDQTSAQLTTTAANAALPVHNTVTGAGAITVKTIYLPQQNETITDVSCSQSRLVVGTNQKWLVYDVAQPRAAKLLFQFERQTADTFFAAEQHTIALKAGVFWYPDANGDAITIKNILLSPDARWVQFQNLLAIVEPDSLKIAHLQQITAGNMHYTQTPVFGAGFRVSETGLWQLVGGKWVVFYHSGNTLSSVYCPLAVQQLFLHGNLGMVTHRQSAAGGTSKTLLTEWVSIRNLQLITHPQQPLAHFTHTAYKPGANKTPGILFQPQDDHLLVRRAEDFAPLQTLPCPNLTAHDRLYYTRAGLVCFGTSGNLVLLNLGS